MSAGRSRRSFYGARPNSRSRYASAYPAQMATLNAAPPATDDAIGRSSRDNARSQVVQAPVRNTIDKPPINDQLEQSRDYAHSEQGDDRRATPLLQRFARGSIKRSPNEQPEVCAHRPAVGGKWRECRDQRQPQAGPHA